MALAKKQQPERVNIDELKRNLAELMRRAQSGETIIVVRADQPIAEIRPAGSHAKRRPFGLCAGEFVVPDDFDAPLPDDLVQSFEGRSDYYWTRISSCGTSRATSA